ADTCVAGTVTALCLCVPALMAAENWDDHDRSNRRTAVEMARNYLNSVGEHGILVTHGDNDTFPLWYAQEVENVRTDVRICNTSLLGTDWHIDQMRYAVNESAPLDISVEHKQYLYGNNEMIPIYDTREMVMSIDDLMMLFRHPDVKAPMTSGRKVDYIASRKISIPVNKENVIKYGILDAKYESQIPDEIIFTISKDKDYITKPELFMLDLLSNYEWDRPLHLLNMGGDLNIGIKEYLTYEGFSFKFIPIKNKTTSTEPGFVDPEELYRKMTQVYKFDAVSADNYFIDYQNQYTYLGLLSLRGMFVNCSNVFMREGQNDRALEMLDRGLEVMQHYPLEAVPLGFSGQNFMVVNMVENYYKLDQKTKARELALDLSLELLVSAKFYIEFYDWAPEAFELVGNYIYFLADVMEKAGDGDLAKEVTDTFVQMIEIASEKS
ncbi:MAG: hypothetical protein IIV12_00850, partial [Bacteroidales bacterium]|nr:hypothetical protein [Bacteroidales bacterium]